MGKIIAKWKMPNKKMELFMKAAIRSARGGMTRGEGGPFGAVLVRKGKVIAVSHNRVLKMKDPTCHAEINAIRAAARKLKSFDLSKCVLFSTTEPCPMCFAAIHWARIPKIYYGTGIADVERRGFNELNIPNLKMKKLGKSRIKLEKGFLLKDCRQLLEDWDGMPGKKTY